MREFYEIETYALAGEHKGKWAVRVCRYSDGGSFIEEQPFISEQVFASEQDAQEHGEAWVRSRGGTLQRRGSEEAR